MMKTALIQFITIILLALVMGVFWGTWLSLSRSIDNFSSSEFTHIGKTIISNVALPMSILIPSSIIFVLISIWTYPQKHSSGLYLYVMSLILIIITLLITLIIEVPIDNQLKLWTQNSLPQDWQSIRRRWELFHTIRTFTSIAALGFSVAGSLMGNTRKPVIY